MINKNDHLYYGVDKSFRGPSSKLVRLKQDTICCNTTENLEASKDVLIWIR